MEMIQKSGNLVITHSSLIVCDSHWINTPNDFLLISPQTESFARVIRRVDVYELNSAS